MLHILANPGVSPDSQIINETLSFFFPAALTFIGGFALMMWMFATPWAKLKAKPRIFFAIPSALIGLGLIGFVIYSGCVMEARHRTLQAKYDSSLVNWLATDYGIKTTTEQAKRLVAGESFSATYHSKDIVISVIKDLKDNLVVVDQNHTILNPKN